MGMASSKEKENDSPDVTGDCASTTNLYEMSGVLLNSKLQIK